MLLDYYCKQLCNTKFYISQTTYINYGDIKMTENINLKELEKKAYRLNFKDGIYDIAWGALLISIAIAPILREIIYLGYIIFLVIPAPLIILLGKKYITLPRIGIVKFNQKRRKAQKRIMLISSILVPLTILLVILTAMGIFPGNLGAMLGGYAIPVGAGVFAIVLLSVTAYLIDYPHCYIYGIIIGLGIPIADILHNTIGPPLDNLLTFGITGIILLIFGIATLSKFLQKYPIPKEEIPNVS